MLNKVLDGRKVCLFGKNANELLVAHYGLFFGNVNISDFVYHKLNEIDFGANDFKQYAFKSDEYYFVVADNENYGEVREVLIKNGYEPIKDFVQFKPLPYVKVWRDND